jgi:GT2 family glycosyltransferase/glycosyltransferase involved in cell wall biosynthesis
VNEELGAESGALAVDVIVPVYRDIEKTRQCLDSILAARQKTAFELIVIDDASPEPALSHYLASLAGRECVTVLRNPHNLGFVRTVNRGMALHPDRDVVLLNSDTEVANDWLERLRRCALSAQDNGTVTPFSNNATICSFPDFCSDNRLPAGLTLAQLDAIFRRVNAGKWIEIPTAVGFCMYIRRTCLEQVGPFDEDRFGRGYGEENDFSRRVVAMGWKNVLCADTFVYHAGGASFGAERELLQASAAKTLLGLHPDYDDVIRRFVMEDPAAEYRRAVSLELESERRRRLLGAGRDGDEQAESNVPGSRAKPVQLHLVHDLGGGIGQWLEDYCLADSERINLVLKPFSRSHAFGEGLALYGHVLDQTPQRLWLFSEPIKATAVTHAEYRDAVREVLETHAVGGVIVSSLIGHSLDILATGLPTLVICHDYYPYCPAINIHFRGICSHCDAERLADCTRNNHDFNPFQDFPVEERLAVRGRYVDLVTGGQLTLVAPSQSVLNNLIRLESRFRHAGAVVIPHGHGTLFGPMGYVTEGDHERLRVLILGMLASSKGVKLLSEAIDAVTAFADIYLVGSGELGELFRGRAGVHVQGGYRLQDLPEIVARIDPHVGLLMSLCAETYGYTLGELMMLGIPPVVTRVGAFAERIRHGETGYLYEATAASLVEQLQAIDADRTGLQKIARILREMRPRSAADMVNDYHRLLPLSPFAGPDRGGVAVSVSGMTERGVIDLAMESARRWKEIRSLHLTFGVKDALIEQSNQQRELLTARLTETTRQRDEALGMQARCEADLQAMRAATSWRITRPLRWLKQALVRRDASVVAPPSHLADTVPVAEEDWHARILRHYRASFTAEVRQAIRERIVAMADPPLISVLVPTFDTPAAMLEAMIASVRGQLYPHWELCIADDGSTLPHVRAILEAHAARDARIRVDYGTENHGVAHATNRALMLATGRFCVLLDHDDLLEEHALFRVAEAVVCDNPDMLYSDELIVGEDGDTVAHFVLRPAFSPEYLRAHPYIVHLLGFSTEFLRALGGLDESLRISQDYDLILRASEKAAKIVHIPDLLYRWRTHTGSAGHRMRAQVMRASRAILQRHLARCGESGWVNDGAGFNFFDVRYPLPVGARVAILIPTRNRHDLVRACIESIEATVGGVPYDIVLIDHASDDPAARAYFASLVPRVTLLHYEGPFNFGAINNWAAAQLDGSHTHYLFCNNDIVAIEPGWLQRMLELGQKADVGIVGAKLYYPDGKTIQHAGVVVACCGVAENLGRFRLTSDAPVDLGYMGSLICNREVSAVTAACMLIRGTVFKEIGGFDEAIAVGYGDVDLCLRAGKQGYRTLFCAHAKLLHHESSTRGRSDVDPHPEDSARFLAKWRALFATGDPYFNPNLSPHSPNWQVADPLEFELDIRRRIFRWEPGSRA